MWDCYNKSRNVINSSIPSWSTSLLPIQNKRHYFITLSREPIIIYTWDPSSSNSNGAQDSIRAKWFFGTRKLKRWFRVWDNYIHLMFVQKLSIHDNISSHTRYHTLFVNPCYLTLEHCYVSGGWLSPLKPILAGTKLYTSIYNNKFMLNSTPGLSFQLQLSPFPTFF